MNPSFSLSPHQTQAGAPPDHRVGLAVTLLVCLGCLAPFVSKAFHIDDPLFLWAARHIQQHPADPYGFTVNWYGYPQRMADNTKNPPLACYVLALAASLIGWSEVALHSVFLLPAAGAAWGTYRLAEGLCGRPLLAALIAVLTPVFLVSSTNVMCDTLMLCFWVWAIVCWRRGLDRPAWLIVAAILISLCALSKYFGASLIPLLLAYTLAARRRWGPGLAALLIPIAVLAAYEVLMQRLYDRGLFSDAAGFSVGARSVYGMGLLDPLIGLAFTGGCLAGVLFYLPLLWSWRLLLARIALTAALLGSAWVIDWRSPHPLFVGRDWGWPFLLQAALFLFGGIGVVALAVADLWRRRDADAWLLFFWSAGTLVFALGLNWVINGRSLLPLAPAAGILLARRLDLRRGPFAGWRNGREAWPLIPAGLVALAVTAADCRRADADRAAAHAIADACTGQTGMLWFEGHWGFQYYLQQRGGTPLDVNDHHFQKGDFLALPAGNYGIGYEPDSKTTLDFRIVELSPSPGLATMNGAQGAGFYSHVDGPLPFVFGPAAPLRYRVVQFLAPVPATTSD
jgi:4-amino-4-deoxy-L-arabinose transferase-like glycosyltransferase